MFTPSLDYHFLNLVILIGACPTPPPSTPTLGTTRIPSNIPTLARSLKRQSECPPVDLRLRKDISYLHLYPFFRDQDLSKTTNDRGCNSRGERIFPSTCDGSELPGPAHLPSAESSIFVQTPLGTPTRPVPARLPK